MLLDLRSAPQGSPAAAWLSRERRMRGQGVDMVCVPSTPTMPSTSSGRSRGRNRVPGGSTVQIPGRGFAQWCPPTSGSSGGGWPSPVMRRHDEKALPASHPLTDTPSAGDSTERASVRGHALRLSLILGLTAVLICLPRRHGACAGYRSLRRSRAVRRGDGRHGRLRATIDPHDGHARGRGSHRHRRVLAGPRTPESSGVDLGVFAETIRRRRDRLWSRMRTGRCSSSRMRTLCSDVTSMPLSQPMSRSTATRRCSPPSTSTRTMLTILSATSSASQLDQ